MVFFSLKNCKKLSILIWNQDLLVNIELKGGEKKDYFGFSLYF